MLSNSSKEGHNNHFPPTSSFKIESNLTKWLMVLLFKQDDRTTLLEELAEKEALNSKLQQELDQYRDCDPEVVEEVKTQTVVAKEAANRWTGM